MKRVLIVKMWALGDILMATPLLTNLRARFPGVEITWLVDSHHADVLRDHPLIDDLVVFDSGRWRRLLRRGKLLSWLAEGRDLHRSMRERQFDTAINCHPEKWWTRLLCPALVRVGLYPSPNLTMTGRLYTHSRPKPLGLHSTDDYLLGLEALGQSGPFSRRMALEVSERSEENCREFLRDQPEFCVGMPLVVLHPGASQPSKCWPLENFATVAAGLSNRCNLVITGSNSEQPLAEAISSLLPDGVRRPMIAAGRVETIGTAAALIRQASAVVTGDTSALHLASALGTPVVGIYGSTRPGDNAPLFGESVLLYDDAVPCAPCYKAQCPLADAEYLRCLRAVTPVQVLAALDVFLKESEKKT